MVFSLNQEFDDGGTKNVACMEKGHCYRRMNVKGFFEGLRDELRKNSLCICFGVEGLWVLVAGIAFFAGIFCFFLLELPGVKE